MIRPDDIVFIPGSGFKNFTYGLLGSLPGTITRVPTDLIYR